MIVMLTSVSFVLQMTIGRNTVDAISRRYGTRYTLGSTASTLCKYKAYSGQIYVLNIQIDWLCLLIIDVATGGSADWAFGIHHTGLSYTFELRDVQGGPHGFLLPADQIIPNCLEFLDGIKALVQTARALNQL